ncbi:MAG: LysE family translocator [Candidatus Thiodiazotropha lotti]|nr:LysE family translocator [Candidatus Thiodiazotropha lotti]ODC01326.1 threonine transporter RhtB [Candidatus Thiodiazotropha endoloripes]MCG7923160.1 LysE family translocator [Candidatus Thiodiazotropha lotti]MCG8003022.1 LysE family translocator [Candidatus Thiodiazotropha lotti]MCG8008650.1 LysE family translocator [Candidatus Thiodiazotropha lotti]
MDISLYSIFLVTTVMLILVPGPAAITIAAQGASHNSQRAFFGVLGVASADVLFFTLSATGIASLILASNLMFSVIKWFGVAYLLYLGISALFSKTGIIKLSTEKKESNRKKLFSQGLVVQLANPKALMYFTALLPQFIDPSKPVLFQMLLMGASCLLADIIVYSVFSRLGDRIAKQQLKSWVTTLINKAAGITLISTGIRMASLEYGK